MSAFHFSAVSTTAFDAVYYAFSHRAVVNFESALNDTGTIEMTDSEILSVLHAHTRAIEIQNFALPPTFTSFQELHTYFCTYMAPPIGQLFHIQCPYSYHSPLIFTLASTLDEFDEYGVNLDDNCMCDQVWSNTDLDLPYIETYGYDTEEEQYDSDIYYLQSKQTPNSWQHQLYLKKQQILKAKQLDAELNHLSTITKEDLDEEYREHLYQELYESCFPDYVDN